MKIICAPGGWRVWFFKWFTCWFQLYFNFIINPYKIYRELWKRPKAFAEMPNRSGEVAVLTGGTRGVGLELLKKLLIARFHVILGCRSIIVGHEVVEKIRASGIATGSTKVFELDLKSMKSVRRFAANILKEVPRVDVLINNAGIIFPYELTEDGFESQFQVNYLSHFLLTDLLLDRIKETAKRSDKTRACRIVNTASEANNGADLDFDDLEICKVFTTNKSYCDSKLCLIMHARYLDKILQIEEEKVNVYSLHPGIIKTNLWRDVGPCVNIALDCLKYVNKTAEDGANTIMYTALSPELEGVGGVYINTQEIAKHHRQAYDVGLQKRLYERSKELCQ